MWSTGMTRFVDFVSWVKILFKDFDLNNQLFIIWMRLDGVGISLGSSPTAPAPSLSPPPPAASFVSSCGRFRRPSPSLTHLYIQLIYIYILGSSPHFLSFVPFVSSSHPSYVALTWRIILQGRAITIPHSLITFLTYELYNITLNFQLIFFWHYQTN
ncbi:hypothetical protein HanXRQr2_Chr17g0781301 [Helianthus annuus]|uniref:Uncharacterized protein n=1 Tax=Helianthus annuus TaxID=4232 RepID=A0A9K3DES1_HELAN|nr:hypothetical protein HanXRQr2_Chr17g0781301 [Helianthus annuus]